MEKNKSVKIIDEYYLTSGNEFCNKCKVSLQCSKCPMLKAMIELKDKIKEAKEFSKGEKE